MEEETIRSKVDSQFLIIAVVAIVIILFLAVSSFVIIREDPERFKLVNNFNQPTNNIGTIQKDITNLNLTNNAIISSPFLLTGEIKKSIVDQNFKINVENDDGKVIGGGSILTGDLSQFNDDDMVEFSSKLYFNSLESNSGKISFTIAGESGDDTLVTEVDVRFQVENIVVYDLYPNDRLVSGFTVSGKARTWFHDRKFPVKLVTEDETVLWQGDAIAAGGIDDKGFIQFSFNPVFEHGDYREGQLIFNNANPTGIDELKEEFVIPVKF